MSLAAPADDSMRGDEIMRQRASGRGNRPGRQYPPCLQIGIPKEGAADGDYKVEMTHSKIPTFRVPIHDCLP